MKKFFIKIDSEKIKERTFQNNKNFNKILKNIENYQKDSDLEKRTSSKKCKFCFYLKSPKIVGQAFTTWTCGVCEKEFQHHNTGTTAVCDGCSNKLFICIDCGASIE